MLRTTASAMKNWGKGFLNKSYSKLKDTGRYIKNQSTKRQIQQEAVKKATAASGKKVFRGTYAIQEGVVEGYKTTSKRLGDSWAGTAGRWTGNKLKQGLGLTRRVVGNTVRSDFGKIAGRSLFGVGAVSMVGLNIMKGGMNAANEIVHERYMQDYTYSKNIMHNSMVGMASGTNRMLNKASTQGLTLSLHRTRHGR